MTAPTEHRVSIRGTAGSHWADCQDCSWKSRPGLTEQAAVDIGDEHVDAVLQSERRTEPVTESSPLADEMNRRVYEYLVGRQMTCPITGKVLDIRTAVVVEAADGIKTYGIVSPEAWAQIKPDLLSKFPDLRVVIDAQVQPKEEA